MESEPKYDIETDVKYGPLELIDIGKLIQSSRTKWKNCSLSRVNDCVVRLGVIEGDFLWHKHDREDEFFFVIDGQLFIDLKDREDSIKLRPGQGIMVPKGVVHRTRAPKRTSILMVEGSTVKPTGD
jgi:mannose-6-phosphate isomerase-like protein (cupin superfamily)